MATSFAPDRSRVPGPSTWLPGGAFWAFRKDPLAFFTNTARTYGDIAGFSFGPQKVYLVSRPEWVEDILVKSAGKFAKGGSPFSSAKSGGSDAPATGSECD